IKGDTPHFEYVASEAAKGIANIALTTGIPAVFGVITSENLEQAIERAGAKGGNKGEDAARVAVEMANLMEMIG
ncbi:MAG: 6,7-dimethyl-8-ribityllumazine synthase, partial [Saprospiraceae bacterium]|nr:6,7-dimethyl-8-ribityllumazine synthase [Saprospiraceae bacterium]